MKISIDSRKRDKEATDTRGKILYNKKGISDSKESLGLRRRKGRGVLRSRKGADKRPVLHKQFGPPKTNSRKLSLRARLEEGGWKKNGSKLSGFRRP